MRSFWIIYRVCGSMRTARGGTNNLKFKLNTKFKYCASKRTKWLVLGEQTVRQQIVKELSEGEVLWDWPRTA